MIQLTLRHPAKPLGDGSVEHKLTGFRFFWLKYVNGIDTRHHCALSLKGQLSKRVNREMGLNRQDFLVEAHLPGKVWRGPLYLCGVSGRWDNNFHLAFEATEDGSGEIRKPTFNGHEVIVTGARELAIPALPPDFRGLPPKFTTCRNYQFAIELERQGF